MLNYVGIIERKNTVTIDGYSTKKYQKAAIKEIGRWIAENVNEDEGKALLEYGMECLLPVNDGAYFFEMEEVPCASNWNEELDEMEYADGNWYFVIRLAV